jgi:hypothetical protein
MISQIIEIVPEKLAVSTEAFMSPGKRPEDILMSYLPASFIA